MCPYFGFTSTFASAFVSKFNVAFKGTLIVMQRMVTRPSLCNCIFTALKRSLRNVCFHRCLSAHRDGVCPLHAGIYPQADTPQADTPLGRHPPLHSACWDTVNKRVVRIQLECILVLPLLPLFLEMQIQTLTLSVSGPLFMLWIESLHCH